MAAPDDRTIAAFAALAEAQRKVADDLLRRNGASTLPSAEQMLGAIVAGVAADRDRYSALQAAHYQELLALWQRHFGTGALPAGSASASSDRRFAAPEWREVAWFAWLRDSYLATGRWVESLVGIARADPQTLRKLRFFARQFVDAMAPTNFAATNPDALRLALETKGESLVRGLANLTADCARGRVAMTDETAFEVGRNLAVTPGAVVYENDLMQVLQYGAATREVRARPLLIVPPCINKFYILDLQPHNSFVRHAIGNGLTVFMISWRNMTPELGGTSWDQYLEEGVTQAIDVARSITGARKVNTLGFCVGGTLLACTLAMLRRKRRAPAASLTLLATMLDFSDPGEIGVYVDEPYVRRAEQELGRGGLLSGGQLAATFASLRANELVWHYVVNNYLKGRTPDAFDLLHWNADSANLAGTMYAYYLRNMYLENALREPDRLTMCGVPIDLGHIGVPSYVLATKEDHIVPWTSAHASARLLGTDVEFVLGASGHIAGVVNPATANRRSFRTGPPPKIDPADWLAASVEHPGSWWAHWTRWVLRRSGATLAAPDRVGSIRFPPIEPAPGRYVSARC